MPNLTEAVGSLRDFVIDLYSSGLTVANTNSTSADKNLAQIGTAASIVSTAADIYRLYGATAQAEVVILNTTSTAFGVVGLGTNVASSVLGVGKTYNDMSANPSTATIDAFSNATSDFGNAMASALFAAGVGLALGAGIGAIIAAAGLAYGASNLLDQWIHAGTPLPDWYTNPNGLFGPNGPLFGPDGLFGPNGLLFGPDGLFGPNGPFGDLPDLPAWLTGPLNDLRGWLHLPIDPLVLDLNGDGVHLTSLADGVHFDFGGDHFVEKTGWVDANDGILVVDANHNGIIDNVSEMFGQSTNPAVFATNSQGFEELATYDSNSDGKVDASDANFADIKIWQDANHNGRTDTGELKTLAEIGIVSLNTASNFDLNSTDPFAFQPYPTNNGNFVYSTGTFNWADGSTGLINDVGFLTDRVNTYCNGPYTPNIQALFLPQLRGYGTVPDLFAAMCKDAVLQQMVKDFTLDTTHMETLETRAKEIMFRWAGVDGIDPNSNVGFYNRIIPQRVIEFLNVFFDNSFPSLGNMDENLRNFQIGPSLFHLVNNVWQNIVDEITARLAFQGPMASLFTGVDYIAASDTFSGNIHSSVIDSLVANAPPTGDTNALAYWINAVHVLKVLQEYCTVDTDFTAKFNSVLANAGLSLIDYEHLGRVTVVQGDVQDNVLAGGAGVDLIDGGAGNDVISANAGNDIVSGAHGDDNLRGGVGNDSYYYVRGDGHDVIEEDDYYGGQDSLGFLNIGASSATLVRNGDDLTIVLAETTLGAGDGGSVFLKNELDDSWDHGVEVVNFANDTIWTRADMQVMLLAQASTTGNDSIVGFNGDDVITGGKGNDSIVGASGNDTYIYKRGDGHDSITEGYYGGVDKLVLTDINPQNVSLVHNGDDVTLLISESAVGAGDDGSVFIADSLADHYNTGVEQIQFADGTVWTQADLRKQVLTSTSANENLVGFGVDDTYLYARGGGHDTITDGYYGGIDRLALTNVTSSEVALVRVGNDVTIVIVESIVGASDGGSVLLKDSLDEAYHIGVEEVQFGNGEIWARADIQLRLLAQASTSGNDIITGFNGEDTITAGRGNDMLDGATGNDNYNYARGDGHDIITDGYYGGIDKLVLTNITASDVSLVRNGNDLTIMIAESFSRAGDGGTVLLQDSFENHYNIGVEQIQFADGTVWMQSDFSQHLAVINHAPVLTAAILDQTSLEDSTFSFTLPAGTFTDVDNTALSYSASLANDAALPSWLSFDETTQTFSGTPPQDYNGNIEVKVTASDGSLTAFDIFTLTIAPVNDAPIALSDGPMSLTYNTPLTITAASLSANDFDVDNASLTITSVINANHGTVSLQADGSILFTPGADYIGSASFDYAISDGAGGMAMATAIIYVEGVVGQIINGTAAANILTGTIGDDTISGLAGNDTLNGNGGVDKLIGGLGNDLYVVDSVGDQTIELIGEGTDLVQSSITWSLGANLENLTLTGTNNSNGTGNALVNTITGNAGNNVLNGGGGLDKLVGGLGDDTYIVDQTGVITTEAASAGTDTVQSSVTWTLATNLENLILTGIATINGTGNALANVVTGNSADNTLNGGTGADSLVGGAGNDTYIVDNVGDFTTETVNEGDDLVQASITWMLSSNIENLTLTGAANVNGTGNDLDDVITGNSGNNILDGGLGADTLIGNIGNDTFIVDNSGDTTIEAANAGTDTVKSSVNWILADSIENLTLIGSDNLNGMGNGLVNIITGNEGNNILNGAGGLDKLVGGLGDDTYIVDQAAVITTEAASAGTDTVQSSVTWTLATNLENLILTGSIAINGIGNILANSITGNIADNILNGGTGADSLVGGQGNDTYVVDNVGDVTLENVNEGTELVQASITWTLAENLENLTLTGATAINGTGNALDNEITGNTGNNKLNGGLGADTLVGGLGNDTYVVDNLGDIITELAAGGTDLVQSSLNWTLGSELDNLTLTGLSNIDGTGNALANVITANSGNNILNGAGGLDRLVGGLGDDIYVVDVTGVITTEEANSGTDIVQSSVNWTLETNIENLTLTGSAAINATGNTLVNVITGNSSDNVLNGGTGADTLIGGNGNDTYVVDNAGDVVTEMANEGIDLVQSFVTWTLGNNLENLTLSGTAGISGIGNILDNVITGNASANTLNGGAGNDHLIGGAGNDILTGGQGNDIFDFTTGFGKDRVTDFNAGLRDTDVLYLRLGADFDTYGEVMAAATQVGANTLIRFSVVDTITLANVLKTALVADDFLLV